MRRRFHDFLKNEDGAITVDWVVLTAAIVALNVYLMFTPIRDALMGGADVINTAVNEAGDYGSDLP